MNGHDNLQTINPQFLATSFMDSKTLQKILYAIKTNKATTPNFEVFDGEVLSSIADKFIDKTIIGINLNREVFNHIVLLDQQFSDMKGFSKALANYTPNPNVNIVSSIIKELESCGLITADIIASAKATLKHIKILVPNLYRASTEELALAILGSPNDFLSDIKNDSMESSRLRANLNNAWISYSEMVCSRLLLLCNVLSTAIDRIDVFLLQSLNESMTIYDKNFPYEDPLLVKDTIAKMLDMENYAKKMMNS